MKKLVGISIVSLALLAVSCQKEQVMPTAQSSVPTWKKSIAPEINPTPDVNSGSGITDPNNDPDMNSKKGNKQ